MTTTDAAQANEKHSAVKDLELAEVPDDEAADAADKVTDKGAKESEAGSVKEAKEPTEPTTNTSSSTDVAAQGEVRGAAKDKTTESAKVSNGDKKGRKGSGC